MKIRAHRGGLAESLATLRTITTVIELALFVQRHDVFAEGDIADDVVAGISIQPYDERPDFRIDWDKTYAVYYGRGLVGFCDQPFESLT